jgi:hypothetical protein
MDEAKQKGRQLSLQEPAIEVKRNESRETRRRYEQRARFLRMWTADLPLPKQRPAARVPHSQRPRAV